MIKHIMMIESDSEKFFCHWTALKQLLVTEMSIVRKWIIVKSELEKKKYLMTAPAAPWKY